MNGSHLTRFNLRPNSVIVLSLPNSLAFFRHMLRRVTVTDQIVLVVLRLAAAIGAVQTDPDRLVILLHFDLSGSKLGVHRLILLKDLNEVRHGLKGEVIVITVIRECVPCNQIDQSVMIDSW